MKPPLSRTVLTAARTSASVNASSAAANLRQNISSSKADANTQVHEVCLRHDRPDWSFEWRNAKTGGVSTHRRHCVRSGLMRAALAATLAQAKKFDKLNDFFGVAQRILGLEPTRVETLREADILLECLFHRLHNNHMNIFYGSGSLNQMLGTLAHGLEKVEQKYCETIDQCANTQELQQAAVQWFHDVVPYALCEYMALNSAQEAAISALVKDSLDSTTFHFASEAMQNKLDALDLFANGRFGEGPMEIKVHRDRQRALIEVADLVAQRLAVIFADANAQGTAFERQQQDVKNVALDTLDSANVDLSDAADPGIRKLQNQQAIEATFAFSKIVEQPDIDDFADAAIRFLQLEAQGGEQLGLGNSYQSWFKDRSRPAFFKAITAPTELMVPSLESARFAPRQWDDVIRKNFKVGENQQRVQMVPSILVRQVGYAISNLAVATDRLQNLHSLYERIFKLEAGSIEDLDSLQKFHSKLVREVHNNPTNLSIGSRAEQIIRENMLFALETAESHWRNTAQSEADIGQSWFQQVAVTSLEGYLNLTARELALVKNAVIEAIATHNQDDFKSVLRSRLNESLELFADKRHREAPLARYDQHQLASFRNKVDGLIDISADLWQQVQHLNQSSRTAQHTDNIQLASKLRTLSQSLTTHYLTIESPATDPIIQSAQRQLNSYSVKLAQLQQRCRTHKISSSEIDAVLQDYEKTMVAIRDMAYVAKDYGLQRWAIAVGSQVRH